MSRKRKSKKPFTIVQWLEIIQYLIKKYSSAPRKRGKYKGHSMTDSAAWINELARFCQHYIHERSRGKAYDENMALASLLGLILSAWYAQVHRAKGMDPNRPLNRRIVFRQLAKFRANLAVATTDDRIMGKVWGKQQAWNFPFGRGARGGTFI